MFIASKKVNTAQFAILQVGDFKFAGSNLASALEKYKL